MNARPIWIFKMPLATVHVPAVSEEAARSKLVALCYKGAPVHAWPLISGGE